MKYLLLMIFVYISDLVVIGYVSMEYRVTVPLLFPICVLF